MTLADLFSWHPADIVNLIKARDVPALILLLGQTDPKVRRLAGEALVSFGPESVPLLERALKSPSVLIRLGAIESLCGVREKGSFFPIKDLICREKHIELKYAAVLALGEIGSPDSIPDLVHLLQDQSKYIRYGAALSLTRLGWQPADENGRIMYRIALQDWDEVRAYGPAAVLPIAAVSHDPDPATRARIASLLGEIGASEGGTTCEMALRDRDPGVRWAAVLAAMNCGIRPARLPPFVAARERTGPDPVAAAILNFLLLGIGYNYIGKWWGFPVFMTYMCILVLAQLAIGPLLPYLIAFPVTAVLGVHTYYLARRMSDL